jgi:hypothetical protein
MKAVIIVLAFTIGNLLYSQQSDGPFTAHQNLIGGVWKIDALWGDGTPFKASIRYETSLEGTIIKTTTFSITDKVTQKYGLRNEGIRYMDNESGTMKFYEFEVSGNHIHGDINYEGKNIYYSYRYPSEDTTTTITDGWEYVDGDTYDYTVGIYNPDTGKWEKTFLSDQIKRSPNE